MNNVVHIEKALIYASSKLNSPILSDVSLTIGEGELLYLVGRVGSGKSSLMKTIYGELPLRVGKGVVCGFDLRKITSKNLYKFRRHIGVVFQEYNLMAGMSVYENLEFVLRATEWKNKRAINRRIEEVLNTVSMADKAHRLPSEVSGGERQRVCIARAILSSPRLIIADEPTGNLDPAAASEIISLFHTIVGQGCSVILSTHNSENVRLFPSRVVRCADGFLI